MVIQKYILSFQINVSITVHTTTMIAQMYDLILNSKTKLTKNAIIIIYNHYDYKYMVQKQALSGDKSLFLGWQWQKLYGMSYYPFPLQITGNISRHRGDIITPPRWRK